MTEAEIYSYTEACKPMAHSLVNSILHLDNSIDRSNDEVGLFISTSELDFSSYSLDFNSLIKQQYSNIFIDLNLKATELNGAIADTESISCQRERLIAEIEKLRANIANFLREKAISEANLKSVKKNEAHLKITFLSRIKELNGKIIRTNTSVKKKNVELQTLTVKYTEAMTIVEKFRGELKQMQEIVDGAIKIDSKLSCFYAPANPNGKRSANYVTKARKVYPEKTEDNSYLLQEVHHLKLDSSSNDPTSLVYMSSKRHCDLHRIHTIENQLEILEIFENNPDYNSICVNGIGTSFKKGVFEWIGSSDKIERKAQIAAIKENLVEEMDSLLPAVVDELEKSLAMNTAYQDSIGKSNMDSLVQRKKDTQTIFDYSL